MFNVLTASLKEDSSSVVIVSITISSPKDIKISFKYLDMIKFKQKGNQKDIILFLFYIKVLKDNN